MNREETQEIIKKINILDNQLSEDKALFGYLMDNNLVEEEGKQLILKLIKLHSNQFEK